MGLLCNPCPPRDFRCSHFRCQAPPRIYDVRDPSSKRWNCGQECWLVILPKCQLPRYILGIFYMPQICDMGPTALLPLQRKACWGFFCPEKSWRLRSGLNPRTWVLKGSMLPLDHRSALSYLLMVLKHYTLKMKVGSYAETLLYIYQTIWCHMVCNNNNIVTKSDIKTTAFY